MNENPCKDIDLSPREKLIKKKDLILEICRTAHCPIWIGNLISIMREQNLIEEKNSVKIAKLIDNESTKIINIVRNERKN